MDIQKQIEKDIEASIAKHLLKMYGEDNYEISVRTTINLDKKIRSEKLGIDEIIKLYKELF